MRALVCVAASLLIAGCSLPGTASASPSPAPANTPSPSPEASPSPSPSPIASPSPSPSPSPVPSPPAGLFLQIVQSDYGFISAQTAPGARCSAHGTLPNGSNISGIHNPQVAAGDGTVSWNYPQRATALGNGVHVVSCSQGGMTSTASANFQVGA